MDMLPHLQGEFGLITPNGVNQSYYSVQAAWLVIQTIENVGILLPERNIHYLNSDNELQTTQESVNPLQIQLCCSILGGYRQTAPELIPSSTAISFTITLSFWDSDIYHAGFEVVQSPV